MIKIKVKYKGEEYVKEIVFSAYAKLKCRNTEIHSEDVVMKETRFNKSTCGKICPICGKKAIIIEEEDSMKDYVADVVGFGKKANELTEKEAEDIAFAWG
jgi:hypothetical protein